MKKHDNERVMASDPFAEEDVNTVTDGSIYPANSSSTGALNHTHTLKPTHYKTISVSLYLDDIERMDNLVRELKRRGFTKMSRSALIRFALDTVNINDLPPQY